MIPYLIQSKGQCPDEFTDAARREALILAIERVLEDAGFDDIDTTFNQTAGDVVPSGTTVHQLEEARVTVGKNGWHIKVHRHIGDPGEFRVAANNHIVGFHGFGHLREDDGEELMAAIIVQHDEEDRSGLSSEIGLLIRDTRRPGGDDAQFFRPVRFNRRGAFFDCPIFVNGQHVGGFQAVTAGDTLSEEPWRVTLKRVLERIKAEKEPTP